MDDEGNVSIHVMNRVELSDIEGQAGDISATASICPVVNDISEEEPE